MTFLPLIERESLVLARRRESYRLRFWAAMVCALISLPQLAFVKVWLIPWVRRRLRRALRGLEPARFNLHAAGWPFPTVPVASPPTP